MDDFSPVLLATLRTHPSTLRLIIYVVKVTVLCNDALRGEAMEAQGWFRLHLQAGSLPQQGQDCQQGKTGHQRWQRGQGAEDLGGNEKGEQCTYPGQQEEEEDPPAGEWSPKRASGSNSTKFG